MNTAQRFNYLRDRGKYIDSRSFGTYRVHLYQAEGFFTEVWMSPGTDQVRWIEVADSNKVAQNYTKNLDLKKELGL
ncbi:MAG: hypothetical protein MK086_10210 [Flavobacteriales bacterium]|nr:hypothetical protein [Flavobacteriales bacterium]